MVSYLFNFIVAYEFFSKIAFFINFTHINCSSYDFKFVFVVASSKLEFYVKLLYNITITNTEV